MVRLLVCLLMVAILGTPQKSAARDCGASPHDFVQITIGRLDSGQRFYDSYRILDDGRLFRASWSDFNTLFGIGERAIHDQGDFRDSLGAVRQMRSRSGFSAGATGRPALIIDAVAYQNGRVTKQIERRELPRSLAARIDRWQAETPLAAPPPGTYAWTNPSKPDGTTRDLELTVACSDGLASVLDQSMRLGPIVLPVATGAETFTTGPNKYRSGFGAYTSWGLLRFAIVRPR